MWCRLQGGCAHIRKDLVALQARGTHPLRILPGDEDGAVGLLRHVQISRSRAVVGHGQLQVRAPGPVAGAAHGAHRQHVGLPRNQTRQLHLPVMLGTGVEQHRGAVQQAHRWQNHHRCQSHLVVGDVAISIGGRSVPYHCDAVIRLRRLSPCVLLAADVPGHLGWHHDAAHQLQQRAPQRLALCEEIGGSEDVVSANHQVSDGDVQRAGGRGARGHKLKGRALAVDHWGAVDPPLNHPAAVGAAGRRDFHPDEANVLVPFCLHQNGQ
mmetsp:Transcript_43515/g.103717  ORF Transcript_43515/g.103717 Transcript_43515/m.103717 type:complete len:267 (+) Transcript_43515:1626-2426(+)